HPDRATLGIVIDPTATAEWQALQAHHRGLAEVHLGDLFDHDDDRASRFVHEVGDLRVDSSKHRLTDETLSLLVELADRADVTGRAEAMFTGEPINSTEGRAVLHTALRMPDDEVVDVE